MIFTQKQIEEILEVIESRLSLVIATNLGSEALLEEDRRRLRRFGIEIESLKQDWPPYKKAYVWGKLSAILSENQARALSYEDFLSFLKEKELSSLSKREKEEYEVARTNSYYHIKKVEETIKRNVQSIIYNESQKSFPDYEKVIREELSEGVYDRRTLTAIVKEIGKKVDDWSYDWDKVVDTEMNNVFQKGRANVILKKEGGEARVFKDVFGGACRHCIRLYLTGGLGSEPRIFKISELIANGSNVGKKTSDWLPTIESTHPYCRCTLREFKPYYVWDNEKKKFIISSKEE